MKDFQPNGKCGNCDLYERSVKDKTGAVIEKADCRRGHRDGKDCPAEDFRARGKKSKRMSNRKKKWDKFSK